MRNLTPSEIEKLINEDKIVWVSCRKPYFPSTQGKFVARENPEDKKTNLYSFCPYKKGVSLPFLPADSWLIADKKGKEQQKEAIADVMDLISQKGKAE